MNMRDYRLWVIVGGVAAVIVLFLLLRPSDDDEAATTTAATSTAPAETTTVAETLTETSPGVTVTEEQPTVPEPQQPTIDVRLQHRVDSGQSFGRNAINGAARRRRQFRCLRLRCLRCRRSRRLTVEGHRCNGQRHGHGHGQHTSFPHQSSSSQSLLAAHPEHRSGIRRRAR